MPFVIKGRLREAELSPGIRKESVLLVKTHFTAHLPF